MECSADKDLIKNLRETQEQISQNTAEFQEKCRLIDDKIALLRDQLDRGTPDITLNERMKELKTLEAKISKLPPKCHRHFETPEESHAENLPSIQYDNKSLNNRQNNNLIYTTLEP